ncbi:hypothetical protein BH10CHL1_BH10CHL1_49100 [soil metagenome]
MHTSTRLQATDFQLWQWGQDQQTQVPFDALCPNYHPLDRIGVVSPCLEDGVLHTAYALLALTTAFYDTQRTRAIDFFDYPQHFAFVGAKSTDVYTQHTTLPLATPHLWDAWSWLDVWPDNKWITAPPTASGMLKQVFDYQVNRLFWPIDLKPDATENLLPTYVAKMLKTSLQTVYYYQRGTLATAPQQGDTIEIQANAAAVTLVQESIAKLPTPPGLALDRPPSSIERYQVIRVDHFLDQMNGCFAGSSSA